MSEIRKAIVDEAMTWMRTPFHHQARIKGVGVDCANLLIGVYSSVGLVDSFNPEYYPRDWNIHNDRRRFIEKLLEYADPLPEGELPQPGDVAMFNYGKHEAHGAIVVEWPRIIHAWSDVRQVVMSDAIDGPLATRLTGFYRLRGID